MCVCTIDSKGEWVCWVKDNLRASVRECVWERRANVFANVRWDSVKVVPFLVIIVARDWQVPVIKVPGTFSFSYWTPSRCAKILIDKCATVPPASLSISVTVSFLIGDSPCSASFVWLYLEFVNKWNIHF